MAMGDRDRDIFTVLRSVRGITNADVARKAGVSASTVASLRRPVADGGTRFPRYATLKAIARVGGLKHEWVQIEDRPPAPHAGSEASRANAR